MLNFLCMRIFWLNDVGQYSLLLSLISLIFGEERMWLTREEKNGLRSNMLKNQCNVFFFFIINFFFYVEMLNACVTKIRNRTLCNINFFLMLKIFKSYLNNAFNVLSAKILTHLLQHCFSIHLVTTRISLILNFLLLSSLLIENDVIDVWFLYT